MNENDKYFIKRYEELLNKGYCDCNEMNCIDNNSPRRILNIVNDLQSKIDKANKFIKEKISSTQGVINDYMYNKEHNKILIELLREDIEMYKKELNILGGDE